MRFQPRFLQLLREAKSGGVLVEEVTWSRLGQLTNGAVHQGIVMQAAAADTLDLGSLIDGCRDLGEPPLLMALDGITIPTISGPSSVAPRRWVPMVWCCRSGAVQA